MGRDLTNLNIKDSYEGLVQISGSQLTDGTGSLIPSLEVSASFVVSASYAETSTSASHALVSDFASSATSASFATTALLATSASHAVSSDTSVSASHAVQADSATTATTATSASYVLGSNVDGAVASATSASHAVQADSATSADTATSASYALTASFAENAGASTLQDVLDAGDTATGSIELYDVATNESGLLNWHSNGFAVYSGRGNSILNLGINQSGQRELISLGANAGVGFYGASNPNYNSEYAFFNNSSGAWFKRPVHISESLDVAGITYPTADGTSGQVITTDGSGSLTFQDAGGGGSAFPFTGSAEITGSLGLTGSYSAESNIDATITYTESDNISSIVGATNHNYPTGKIDNFISGSTDSIIFGNSAEGNYTQAIRSSGLRNGLVVGNSNASFGQVNGVGSGTARNIFGLGMDGGYIEGLNAYSGILASKNASMVGNNNARKYSVIIGVDGGSNSGAYNAFVIGGQNNRFTTAFAGDRSGILGGANNTITGGAYGGIIMAGNGNVSGGGNYNVIIGGNNHNRSVFGSGIIQAGGSNNDITTTNNIYNVGMFAGTNNLFSQNASQAVILGGDNNKMLGGSSFGGNLGVNQAILGGNHNEISGSASTNGINNAVILGGEYNVIPSGSANTAILASSGSFITSPHQRSAIIGGSALTTTKDDEVVVPNLTISGSAVGEVGVITPTSSTGSMDCSLGNMFTMTLDNGTDVRLEASNIQAGQTINLKLTNNATSAGTISFGSGFEFEGGTPFTATATTSAVDILTFVSFDGTTLQATGLKNFS